MDIIGNVELNNNLNISKKKSNSTYDNNFENLLLNKIQDDKLMFSKHANLRLNTRQINLTNDQIERLENGVQDAKKKGIKESLVLVDNVALVVSIKNNTVITAVDNEKKIFTNIDGAVIV